MTQCHAVRTRGSGRYLPVLPNANLEPPRLRTKKKDLSDYKICSCHLFNESAECSYVLSQRMIHSSLSGRSECDGDLRVLTHSST